jgi:hypothetical protein
MKIKTPPCSHWPKNNRYFPFNKRDSVIKNLKIAIDSLPGIKVICESGDAKTGIRIFFHVGNNKEGLFFLTRCVDNRYWEYGYMWNIQLSVGDMYKNKKLPITYCLNSGTDIGKRACIQAQSLIDNMNYHLNHENFISGFDIKINKFKYIDDVLSYERREKIKKLNKKICQRQS